MSTALALAVVLISVEAAPVAPDYADVGQLVRDACIETNLERSAFERLADERGWRRARMTSQTGDRTGWNLVFHADGAAVILSHVPMSGAEDPAFGTVCTVAVERAGRNLFNDVAAIAESVGLESEPTVTDVPQGGVPVHMWSRFGDRTLTYAAAADGRATISLSRQIVTYEPAPVSPPGN